MREKNVADAALDLDAQYQGMQKLDAAHYLSFSQRQQGPGYRAGWMGDRGEMRIIECHRRGTHGVNEGCIQKIELDGVPYHAAVACAIELVE